jgi:hypothetical protein
MTLSATAVAPKSAPRPDRRPWGVTSRPLPCEANSLEPVLAHGYTVADVDALARKAARASRWAFPWFAERHDLAWFAIIEHLLTTDQTPEFWSLVNHGENAITAHVEREGRCRGVYLADSRVPVGTSMPRFWRYWTSASQPIRSPEDAVVELAALAQIWPRLTPSRQRVLLALATHDDYQQAADSLGKPYHSFVSTISTARKQFLRLWHQHETPRASWGRDRRNHDSTQRTNSITAATIRRRERRRALKAETTP